MRVIQYKEQKTDKKLSFKHFFLYQSPQTRIPPVGIIQPKEF